MNKWIRTFFLDVLQESRKGARTGNSDLVLVSSKHLGCTEKLLRILKLYWLHQATETVRFKAPNALHAASKKGLETQKHGLLPPLLPSSNSLSSYFEAHNAHCACVKVQKLFSIIFFRLEKKMKREEARSSDEDMHVRKGWGCCR